MSNVSMDSSSWSFSSKGLRNTAEIDPFSAVYALKKQNWTGNRILGGKACPVLIKVGNSQTTHFVTSSDVVARLEATGTRNPTEMHPFPQTKMKRCRLEANSAVNTFGPFSFLSMNIDSCPDLKTCPELTLLDFQVPGPKLEANLKAYTFAGSKKETVEFVYKKTLGKHVLKNQGNQLEQPFVLGAPVIIEDKAVTCLLSSSRWPVVGVVGFDEDLKEVRPYFVTANMFAGESCEGSSRLSGVAHARGLGVQDCYELSLKSAEQARDRPTQRKAILNLGIVHSSRGDHRKAIEFYTKSLDMAKEAGDQAGVKLAQKRLLKSYLDLGDAHFFCSRGDPRQAIEFYRKSLDMAKEAGDQAGVKLAQERLRKSYLDLGDTHFFCSRGGHRQAIEFYRKSSDMAMEAGDQAGVKLAQERLRKSYMDLGDTHFF